MNTVCLTTIVATDKLAARFSADRERMHFKVWRAQKTSNVTGKL